MESKPFYKEINLTNILVVNDLINCFVHDFKDVDLGMHINIEPLTNDKDELIIRIKEQMLKIDQPSYIIGKEEGFEEGYKQAISELKKYQDKLKEDDAENEKLIEEKLKEKK